MTRATLLTAALGAATLGLAAEPARAHPHVWVTTTSELVFKDGVLGAVRHVWTFDEMFSSYAAQGLDTDGDGTLTREELQPLAQVNVDSLSEYAFFTFLKVGQFEASFTTPTDYWLEQVGDLLRLHFTLPIEKPMLVGDRPATLEIYDPTYFVDFTFEEEESVVLAGTAPGCSLEIHRPGAIDSGVAARLAEIPAEVRDIPDELYAVTSQYANRAVVSCAS